MSPLRALARLEWRRLRRDALLLTGLVVAGALIPWLAAVAGAALEPELVVGILLFAFGLPAAAALLGATILAGDPALDWVASRAVPWRQVVLVRIALRLAVLSALVVLSIGLDGVVGSNRGGSLVPERWPPLLAWTLAWHAAAIIGSACVKRTLAAAGVAALLLAPLSIALLPVGVWADAAVAVGAGALLLAWTALFVLSSRPGATEEGLRRSSLTLGGSLIGVSLVVVVGGLVVANVAAKWLAARVGEEWETRHGSFEELLAMHPERDEPNATARRLEELAPSVETSLIPHRRKGRPGGWLKEARVREVATWGRGRAHGVGDEGSDVGDADVVDAAAVRRWLDDHAADLAVIRAAILEGEPPRWEKHARRGWSAPIPNLTGHGRLVEVLLADAFAASDEGNVVRVRADLEAAWRLGDALREDRLSLLSQLLAIHEARHVLRAAGRLPVERDRWRPRLEAGPFLQSFVEALRFEAFSSLRAARGDVGELSAWQRVWHRVDHPIERSVRAPLDRLGLAADARRVLVGIERVLDERCGTTGELPGPGAWRLLPSRTFDMSPHVDLLALDVELVTLSLDPPNPDVARVPSAACPELSWLVERHAGELVIELASDESAAALRDGEAVAWWKTWGDDPLPMRWELRVSGSASDAREAR